MRVRLRCPEGYRTARLLQPHASVGYGRQSARLSPPFGVSTATHATSCRNSSTCHVRPALPRRLAFNRAVSRGAKRSSHTGAVSWVKVKPRVRNISATLRRLSLYCKRPGTTSCQSSGDTVPRIVRVRNGRCLPAAAQVVEWYEGGRRGHARGGCRAWAVAHTERTTKPWTRSLLFL